MRKSQHNIGSDRKGHSQQRDTVLQGSVGASHRRRSYLGKRGIFKDCIPRMVFPSNRISRTRFILSGGDLCSLDFCLLSFSGLGFYRGFCPDLNWSLNHFKWTCHLGISLTFTQVAYLLYSSDPSSK